MSWIYTSVVQSYAVGIKLSGSEFAIKYDLPLIQDYSSSITTHCHEILSVSAAWYPQCLWLSNSHKLRSLSGWIIILKRLSISLRFSLCWNIHWHACQRCELVHGVCANVLYDHFWSTGGAWLACLCSVSGHLYILWLGMFSIAAGEEQLLVPHL